MKVIELKLKSPKQKIYSTFLNYSRKINYRENVNFYLMVLVFENIDFVILL